MRFQKRSVSLLFVCLFLFGSNLVGQNFNQVSKLVPAVQNGTDAFGVAVAIDKNTAIIGAHVDSYDQLEKDSLSAAGSVYFYEKIDNITWVEKQKLTAADRGATDFFGKHVDINGDYAIVGSSDEDHNLLGVDSLNNSGSAYVFERGADGMWFQKQKLVASDRAKMQYFGTDVAIYGNYAFIGASGENMNVAGADSLFFAGAVYVFKRNSSGTWQEVQKLVSSDRVAHQQFGVGLAAYGNTCIIGANGEARDQLGLNPVQNSGAVYVFEQSSGGIWEEKQKVVTSDRGVSDNVGLSLAIHENTFVIGTAQEDHNANGTDSLSNTGSAYVITRNAGGAWQEQQKIVAPDRESEDEFGHYVDVDGETVAVGSYHHDYDVNKTNYLSDAGAAYLFELKNNSWDFAQKIVPNDRGNAGWYGAVGISDNTVLVGAQMSPSPIGAGLFTPIGSVYAYSLPSVSGTVYNDYNKNCIQDSNEPGVKGSLGVVIPENEVIVTDENGTWYLNQIDTGSHTVIFDTTGHHDHYCNYKVDFSISSNDTAKVLNSFGIALDKCSKPFVNVTMPFMRRCFPEQMIYISIENSPKAYDTIFDAFSIVDLDRHISIDGSSHPFTRVNPTQYKFELGDLVPGASTKIRLSTTLSCDAVLEQTLCIHAKLYPVDTCSLIQVQHIDSIATAVKCDVPWDKSSLSVDGECIKDSVKFTIKNTGELGGGDMQCTSMVRILLDGELVSIDSVKLKAQEVKTYVFLGEGQAWRVEADQHPLHPGKSRPNSTVEYCANLGRWTPGLVDIFSMDDAGDHIDVFCGQVRGSYDPNDKQGSPRGITDTNFIAPNLSLNYLIRFQNTGNDTAFTVVIRDTLEQDLNLYSVKTGASSHQYDFRIYGNRILEWTFNEIYLVDSITNEPLSHGFVSFQVDQMTNLSDNTEINNRVGIYFDYNDPIITNTTSHVIRRPSYKVVQVNNITSLSGQQCSVYPNPSKAILNVKGPFIQSIKLVDMRGKNIYINDHVNEHHVISVSKFSVGLYSLIVQFKDGSRKGYKVVIQH